MIREGVLEAAISEIMERMEVFESTEDFVQETQFEELGQAQARELCYGQSPEDSLGFEDYMQEHNMEQELDIEILNQPCISIQVDMRISIEVTTMQSERVGET